jgi:hypothetical protein
MTVLLTVLALLLGAVNLVMLVLLLRRPSPAPAEGPDAVRTELRLGRDESRTAAFELRAEILRQMQHIEETLRRTLTDHAQLQQSHQAGIAAQLRELADRAQSASDQQRSALDLRLKELQEGTDKRLVEVRGVMGTELKAGTESLTGALERIRGMLSIELRAGTEGLTAALERMNAIQAGQLTAMAEQLKELGRTNHEALERIRGGSDGGPGAHECDPGRSAHDHGGAAEGAGTHQP